MEVEEVVVNQFASEIKTTFPALVLFWPVNERKKMQARRNEKIVNRFFILIALS